MTETEQDLQQSNMISNLPLIFANGYPTSLEKISEAQLQGFIPFMVQCSLGHINLQDKIDCSEPEWWPEEFPFTIPFVKPKKFNGNWMEKMKEIVVICYTFHKSLFLLRFCNDLASYEHASLRFINNYNSTTSLFDRRSNKLLVTFRNENMSYDQPQRIRKTLLQQKSKNGRQTGEEVQHIMVEPAPFDIYLCDSCDAELYSKDAILEHEKTCNVEEEDDDVIFCDTPEPREHPAQREAELNEQRNAFLLNFNLQYQNTNSSSSSNSRKTRNAGESTAVGADASASSTTTTTHSAKEDNFVIQDKNKRLPRRNRAVHSLTRCPMIPLSSPAGQLLLRTTKSLLTLEYIQERYDRIERFCHAPQLVKHGNKPKFFERKSTQSIPNCTFKKPQEYSQHKYGFPRRQFSQQRRSEQEQFLLLNSPLIKRCRPISVKLKKLNESEMKRKRPRLSTTSSSSSSNSNNNNNNNSLSNNNKLNIKLTRDTTRNNANWKITTSAAAAAGAAAPQKEIIVDTIDLCSSDEELEQQQPQPQQQQQQQQQAISPNGEVKSLTPQPQPQSQSEPQPESQTLLPQSQTLTPPPLISSIDITANSNVINVVSTPIVSTDTPCLPLLKSLLSPTSKSKVEYAKKRLKSVNINIKEVSIIPIRKTNVNNCNNNSISNNNNNNNNNSKTETICQPPPLKLMSNHGIEAVAMVATNAKNPTTPTIFQDNNNLLLTPAGAQIIATPAGVAAVASSSPLTPPPLTDNNNCTTTAAATTTGTALSQILLPQPLRPSVYIFSNYTANPLTALVSATATTNEKLLENAESVAFRNDNQENKQHQQQLQQQNQQQNNTLAGNASIVTKCGSNVVNLNATTTPTWFADANGAVIAPAPASSSHNNVVENVVGSPLMERDCGSRNLSLVQPYGSPGRIVSIDLTI